MDTTIAQRLTVLFILHDFFVKSARKSVSIDEILVASDKIQKIILKAILFEATLQNFIAAEKNDFYSLTLLGANYAAVLRNNEFQCKFIKLQSIWELLRLEFQKISQGKIHLKAIIRNQAKKSFDEADNIAYWLSRHDLVIRHPNGTWSLTKLGKSSYILPFYIFLDFCG